MSDLISRDEAIVAICRDEGCVAPCEKKCVVVRSVLNVPAVDAVPVVHGDWIPKKTMINHPFAFNMYCSVCKSDANMMTPYVLAAVQRWMEGKMMEKQKKFCENCSHYAEFEGVCCNPESENVADFMCPFDCCGKWTEKENNE